MSYPVTYFDMHKAMQKLRSTAAYSDLTIKCGGDVQKVHKAIVCPQVEFFAAAERFGGKSGVVELPDDDPEIVKRMLDYLYYADYAGAEGGIPIEGPRRRSYPLLDEEVAAGLLQTEFPEPKTELSGKRIRLIHRCSCHQTFDYFEKLKLHFLYECDNGPKIGKKMGSGLTVPEEMNKFDEEKAKILKEQAATERAERENTWGDPQDVIIHAKMYALADKYGLTGFHGLRDLARDKFFHAAYKHWDTLKFAEAIHVVFDFIRDDEKGLDWGKPRNVIARVIATHISRLFKKDEVRKAMCEHPELAYGVLGSLYCYGYKDETAET